MPDILIVTGVMPEVSYGGSSQHSARIKLDDGVVRGSIWVESTSYHAMFLDEVIAEQTFWKSLVWNRKVFLKHFATSKTLLFEFQEFQKGTRDIAFNTDGLDIALAANKKACGL